MNAVETSGAIQRYVPVSAVIISVNVSSLAKPRSTSFTVLWSAVSNKFSAQSEGKKHRLKINSLNKYLSGRSLKDDMRQKISSQKMTTDQGNS